MQEPKNARPDPIAIIRMAVASSREFENEATQMSTDILERAVAECDRLVERAEAAENALRWIVGNGRFTNSHKLTVAEQLVNQNHEKAARAISHIPDDRQSITDDERHVILKKTEREFLQRVKETTEAES